VRKCSTDRDDPFAGRLRWTRVEPLEPWSLELGPNDSDIEWELNHQSRAPMWELLPIAIRTNGRVISACPSTC